MVTREKGLDRTAKDKVDQIHGDKEALTSGGGHTM